MGHTAPAIENKRSGRPTLKLDPLGRVVGKPWNGLCPHSDQRQKEGQRITSKCSVSEIML